MDIFIIIFLLLSAIILIIAEIFLLPGITVAGIGGTLFAIGGIAYAYSINATTGNIALISSIAAFCTAFLWLMRSNSFKRVALHADIDSTIGSPRDTELKIGDKGISVSRLAPIGKARFGKLSMEAKSLNGFIDENTPIVILQIKGYQVVVDKIKTEAPSTVENKV